MPVSRETAKRLAAERLSIVDQETTIRFQFLPVFLVERILAQSGAIEGSLSQTLTRYKRATGNIIAAEKAAVRPYVKANPAIHFPLSKPELEALKNLVDLQASSRLGKRWQDHHASLLHSESARHMAAAANAFAGLITRAREAEHTQKQIRLAEAHEARQRQRQRQDQARLAAQAEAKRIAAEEKANRLAAQAEAKRVAAEEKASRLAAQAQAKRIADERARIAAETVRAANTFHASGPATATGPLFMTAAGAVAVAEAATLTLQAAIGEAISALGGLAASVGAGAVVGVTALLYSSKLGNGELTERYAFSTSLTDLAPDSRQDLHAIAAAGGKADLPYRVSSKTAADGQSEIFVVKTDSPFVPSQVRVVAATYNPEQNVFTASTADVPPRTLTWTPIVNPGNASTTLPPEQPAPVAYTGATVIPVAGRIDVFPAVSEASFDDFITVFPVESGLPPLYTMFRDRREDPGVATGVGQPVSGSWLGAASQGVGAPVPSQIAEQLRGREFKNFRGFREAFWKAVANDPELARQFIRNSISEMKNGRAPFVQKKDRVGQQSKFELHHVMYISDGGGVLDIDNIMVVTPKQHDAIHARGNSHEN